MGILQDAGARLVLTNTATQKALAKAHLGAAPPPGSPTFLAPTAWRHREPTPSTAQLPEASALAFLQDTSGSTGNPKGVMVTHANLIHNETVIKTACNHDDSTVFCGWLPIYHDMGLIGNIFQPLFLGVKSVLMSPMTFLVDAVGLAAGDLEVQGHDQRRAELRLRALRAPGDS